MINLPKFLISPNKLLILFSSRFNSIFVLFDFNLFISLFFSFISFKLFSIFIQSLITEHKLFSLKSFSIIIFYQLLIIIYLLFHLMNFLF